MGVSEEIRQRRRGSRRLDATTADTAKARDPRGFVERVLSFEAYTGFPHQEVGILAGLWHAIDLWVRRGRSRTDRDD